MKKKGILPRSIRGKLVFYLGITVALVVLLILLVFSQSMYSDLIKNNDLLIKAHTQEIANRIDERNLEAVTIAKTMALAQKSGLFGKRGTSTMYARNILLENPKFTGSYFGYEPNADQNDKAYLEKNGDKEQGLDKNGRFLPYWFVDANDNDKVKVNPLIDMEKSLYYQGCKENFLSGSKDKYMITEPYFYEGKMIVEQTFPIEIEGEFMGVAGVDRALTDIHTYLEGFKPYKSAAFVLLSRKGRIISSTMDLASEKTFGQLMGATPGEDKEAEAQVDKKMMTRNIAETDYKNILTFFYEHTGPPVLIRQSDPLDGNTYLFSGAKIETGDWTIVMRVSESEVMAPIKRTLVNVLVISFIGLSIILVIITLVARRISGPISQAVDIAKKVADGDFTAKVDVRSEDEMGHLLSALETMTKNLSSLVGQVQRSGIQVTSSSTELAATAKEQEVTMTAQVASTIKMVKSVEDISHVATDLVDTMQHVASMSQETAGFASSGQEDLARMEETMYNMENASKSISGRLETINEKAENIT
ncbi:MAG: methyl-accepting chemotaxis protein, partial [Desulfobacteraceae bacterium]|nr:methyl-accepting chemotaxis protein [Desulfobacteraceae bacterium]